MGSIATVRPISRQRLEAIGEVAAYLTRDAGFPGQRRALTLQRTLDMHSKVYINEGSVCVVRHASSIKATLWTVAAVFAQSALLLPSWPIRAAAIALLSVAVCSAASAIEACRQAKCFIDPPTHVLSDVVRFRADQRGSGAALVRSVLDTAATKLWSVGGTAANTTLLRSFYVPLGWIAAGDLHFRSPHATR